MKLIDLAAPGIAGLTPYQPGKPIEELERELGISDSIKLASNENPFGPSPKALAAANNSLKETARYPDGNGFKLKQALADKHGVNVNQISLGNGSNEILELIARLFLMPGTQAMFSAHAFAVYPIVTQAAGAEPLVVPTVATSFETDFKGMLAKLNDKVRLIFIANPNNPTGNWVTQDALYEFIKTVPPQVVTVIDEAYFEYVDKPGYDSALPWINEFPNLLVTRTFSKIYGLAGFRMGYSVSQPELAELLNRVRQPFNINLPAQAAALAALDDDGHVEQSKQKNLQGMQQLEAGLKEMGLNWIPSAGNFVSVDFNKDAMPIYNALMRQGVIVRPVANYGMPTYLRITVGSEQENERFLSGLRTILND